MKNIIIILSCLIIGFIAGYLISNLSKDKYSMMRVPDSGSSYGDLIILDKETGDIYVGNESDGYKNFEKRKVIK
ncbi:hypothetical protein OMO38_04165 [Chryseobacterium sp. 09-1422]|uniref:Uncharacterized protein n=1 Tax=Chryseobacterium kimseyorum TaxID=2984028 RepID=A0ABT3HV94_9FLAO|nr:hypothetical protein [Chryseobacterium kimseyorum]MCW3167717.1 hypothetical protein [Chryseobacterium kimseyorum]